MIVTFYSFKGGVGRTLALANTGLELSRRGHRVLMVDFDLEAPGLDRCFTGVARSDAPQRPGVLEMLEEQRLTGRASARAIEFPIHVAKGQSKGRLELLTSGLQDASYPLRLLKFKWHDFFAINDGGEFFEDCRRLWNKHYDFVLVDSRTGITDAGGVCTIQLPDIIVPVFTASRQSVDGVLDILSRAQRGRQNLAYDRSPAAILPILSRFDTRTEYAESQRWMDEIAELFDEFYESWLPRTVPVRQAVERTKLPHVAYFSYGERLPALEESGTDPESLSFALKVLAGLVEGGLQDVHPLDSVSSASASESTQTDALISELDAYCRSVTSEMRVEILNVLSRLVRITPSVDRPGKFSMSAAALRIDGLSRNQLAEVRNLRAVLIDENYVMWRDAAIASEWLELRQHVANNLEFLLWAQRVRDVADSSPDAHLRGLDLLQADRWQSMHYLLIEEERAVLYLSQSIRREAHRSIQVVPRLRAAITRPQQNLAVFGGGAGVGASVVAVSFTLMGSNALLGELILGGVVGAGMAWLLYLYWNVVQVLRIRNLVRDERLEVKSDRPAVYVRRALARSLASFGYESTQAESSVTYFRVEPGRLHQLPSPLNREGAPLSQLDVYLSEESADKVNIGESLFAIQGPSMIIRRAVRRSDVGLR